jgi:hypothetical protein
MDISAVYKVSARADVLRLSRHFDAIAGAREMPRWRDFRPADVSWLLGRIYLIDVLDGGTDYRFRLFGVFWEKMYGTDLTGQRLSEVEATGRLTALRGDYDTVVAGHEPLFHSGRLIWPDKKSIHYERLLIPFSGDDGQVSVILVALGCDVATDDLVKHKGKGGLPRLVLD